MIQFLFSALLLSFSFNAFAGEVPESDIPKVNVVESLLTIGETDSHNYRVIQTYFEPEGISSGELFVEETELTEGRPSMIFNLGLNGVTEVVEVQLSKKLVQIDGGFLTKPDVLTLKIKTFDTDEAIVQKQFVFVLDTWGNLTDVVPK